MCIVTQFSFRAACQTITFVACFSNESHNKASDLRIGWVLTRERGPESLKRNTPRVLPLQLPRSTTTARAQWFLAYRCVAQDLPFYACRAPVDVPVNVNPVNAYNCTRPHRSSPRSDTTQPMERYWWSTDTKRLSDPQHVGALKPPHMAMDVNGPIEAHGYDRRCPRTLP